jgi:two-component system CheB/CheR fusion protein
MKGCDNIVKKKTEEMEKIKKSKEKHLHTAEETLVNNLHDSDADSNKFPKKDFPIVGIGASAGGLAAFEAFCQSCPPTPI